MRFLFFIILFIVSSCANHLAIKYNKAKRLHEEGHTQEAQEIFIELCKEKRAYAESCSFVNKAEENTTPVVDYFFSEENYNNIRKIVCRNLLDKQECEVLMNNTLQARLYEAYPWANFESIGMHCRANPEKCHANPTYIETVIKQSHQRAVADNEKTVNAIKVQENNKMWSGIFMGISSQLEQQRLEQIRMNEIREFKKKTTNCTTIGNNTTCTSH